MIKLLLISLLFAAPGGPAPLADTTCTRVSMESSVAAGDYRNIFDGSTESVNRLGASASRRLGDFLLYGNFNYGYDLSYGTRWRGWTDPYETPFMVCDSIPGTVSREIYDMQAVVAYKAGRWIFGADLAYTNSLMAKRKDLRNKNTRMDFSAAPLLGWEGERLKAVFKAGYTRNTERVEYMQVDASTEKYLFDLYGLWLYNVSGFSSAENRRQKTGGTVFADLSLGLDFGGGSSVSYSGSLCRGSSVQTETGYNNLNHGTTETFCFRNSLDLVLSGRHFLALAADMSQMRGLRAVQRQELDPDSKIRRWYSYGDPSDVYWRETYGVSASYLYKGLNWEAFAGLSWTRASHAYKEYPVLFSQDLTVLSPEAGGSVMLLSGRASSLKLSPSIMARRRLSGDPGSRSVSGDITVEQGQESQLSSPMAEEYSFWSADAAGAALKADYIRALTPGKALTFSASVKDIMALSGTMKNNNRLTVTISAGYNF